MLHGGRRHCDECAEKQTLQETVSQLRNADRVSPFGSYRPALMEAPRSACTGVGPRKVGAAIARFAKEVKSPQPPQSPHPAQPRDETFSSARDYLSSNSQPRPPRRDAELPRVKDGVINNKPTEVGDAMAWRTNPQFASSNNNFLTRPDRNPLLGAREHSASRDLELNPIPRPDTVYPTGIDPERWNVSPKHNAIFLTSPVGYQARPTTTYTTTNSNYGSADEWGFATGNAAKGSAQPVVAGEDAMRVAREPFREAQLRAKTNAPRSSGWPGKIQTHNQATHGLLTKADTVATTTARNWTEREPPPHGHFKHDPADLKHQEWTHTTSSSVHGQFFCPHSTRGTSRCTCCQKENPAAQSSEQSQKATLPFVRVESQRGTRAPGSARLRGPVDDRPNSGFGSYAAYLSSREFPRTSYSDHFENPLYISEGEQLRAEGRARRAERASSPLAV